MFEWLREKKLSRELEKTKGKVEEKWNAWGKI